MSRFLFILSMIIFSTLGIFISPLSDVPSAVIAFARAFLGTAVLLFVMLISRRKTDKEALRQNRRYVIPSGIFLGFNWVLLFEGYKLTGVATATLCYYLAPALVILLSPILLREKITVLKLSCALVALLGMIPVSGILDSESKVNLKGVLISLAAAVLYALIVIMNKKVKKLSGIETTAVQLGISALVMAAYIFVDVGLKEFEKVTPHLGTLIILGVVHTGIAYLLYFMSIKRIPASSAALLSYIDPAGALILSYTFLREPFSKHGLVGIILILGASVISELPSIRKKKKKSPTEI